MNNPVVSIIIPVYNAENYLSSCLNSVVAQTFADFEAILVDDGSTDRSGAVCDEYAEKDKRFVVLHKQNEGVAIARITAFNYSKGELVTFIDSDDYVSPNYLEHLYNCILNYKVDMVCGQYMIAAEGERLFSPEKRPLQGIFDKNEIKELLRTSALFDKTTHKSSIAPYLWGKMIKREFLNDVLNNVENLTIGEDHVCVLLFLSKISSLFIIPDVIYFYVQHNGQVTNRTDISRWDANLAFFSKISEIDTDCLFKDQLPYKQFNELLTFTCLQIKYTDYEHFRYYIEYSTNSLISILNNYSYSGLNFKEWLCLKIIKKKHFILLYMLLSVWMQIKKIIK